MKDTINTNKLNLIYNKIQLVGNHPVFWSSPNDTSCYDLVIKTMTNYSLIDSFYINYNPKKIYDDDEYPMIMINDKALVVYYIIRKGDLKIIRKFRTRRYWKINKHCCCYACL